MGLMNQTISPREPLRQTLQTLLQPDEQLLWSDSPHVRKLRFPVSSKARIFDLLFNAFLALLFATFLSWIVSVDAHKLVPFWINIPIFLCFFLLFSLRSFLKTFTAAFKKAPPYRRATLYAITDHRAIIMICLPGSKPTILSYFPHEIDDLPTSRVRPDGSGILTFGALRHAKIGRFGPEVPFPGSFLGIARVQEVAALLRQLKMADIVSLSKCPIL
jgi:hypothetical protein